MQTLDTAVAFLLANNLLFIHFFGLKEGLKTDGSFLFKIKEIVFMAVLMILGALILWLFEHFGLPSGLTWLRLPVYTAVLWGLSELSVFLFRDMEGLPGKREILLNSFLLGACYSVLQVSSVIWDVLFFALAAVVGYFLSFLALNAVESRVSRERVPSFIQGLPLKLMTCGLITLVLNGLAFSFSAGGR